MHTRLRLLLTQVFLSLRNDIQTCRNPENINQTSLLFPRPCTRPTAQIKTHIVKNFAMFSVDHQKGKRECLPFFKSSLGVVKKVSFLIELLAELERWCVLLLLKSMSLCSAFTGSILGGNYYFRVSGSQTKIEKDATAVIVLGFYAKRLGKTDQRKDVEFRVHDWKEKKNKWRWTWVSQIKPIRLFMSFVWIWKHKPQFPSVRKLTVAF